MDRFILIDGNAIMHRAFHAYPPSLTYLEKPINAVYGFFTMLFKIIEDQKPTHLAVAFDRPKPTFRKMLYAGYQAKRPQMADGLSEQFVIVHDILEKVRIPIFEIDGYEADDLLGTLAKKISLASRRSGNLKLEIKNLQEGEFETIIVTGDRDLLQLVNEHTKILAPIVGMTNMILFDENKVVEKYGLKPSQFVDYKALIGDGSDNYPGVNGIGPKTAVRLLETYETFESIYQHLGDIAPKIAEKLATDAEQAALAKKLAAIAIDAPLTLKIDLCEVDKIDKKAMEKEFADYGFKSLLAGPFFAEKRSLDRENKQVQLNLLGLV